MISQYDDLALILFTLNRHIYLERSIGWLRLIGLEDQVYIMDASTAPWPLAKATKARYFHLPQMPILSRFQYALENCASPFIHLVADDDFLLPHYIRLGLAWLRKHPDYSAAHGFLGRVSLGEHIIFSCQEEMKSYRDNAASTAEERMLASYSPFLQQVYALIRREVLQEFCTYAHVLDRGDHMAPVVERIFTLVVAQCGKNKYLSTISIIREGDNPKSLRFIPPLKRAEAWVSYSWMVKEALQGKGVLTPALADLIDGYAEKRIGDEFLRLRGVKLTEPEKGLSLKERLQRAHEAEKHAELYRHASQSALIDPKDRNAMRKGYGMRGQKESLLHIPYAFAYASEVSQSITQLDAYLHGWLREL